ncbi:MAG TPA: pitrilysin family protein [Bacteroidota bacterium]|nr:pitrilysin family protein [Bacteroidota bacterium]
MLTPALLRKIQPDPSVPSLPIYRKTVLPNGIRIVSEQVSHVRSIAVGVWVDVGSRDEDHSNNGISHFLEHMVFKGTRRYSANQIARSLEAFGGYLNAFTTKEHTCFYARILDDQLPRAMDILSDLVQHPTLDLKEMEKEKTVILEELKNIEDDPDDLIHEYFDRNLYHQHPLGFPIIGRAENIRGFNKTSLLRYIGRFYTSNRLVVSAVGNFRHEDLVGLAEKYFRLPVGKPGRSDRVASPRNMKPRKEFFHKPINQAHVCYGTLGYGVRSTYRYSLLVLNTILGEGMSSRLFQNIREKYGFAYSIYSFLSLMSDTGNFGVYIGTDPSKVDKSVDLIRKEIDKLRSGRIGAEEIRRAKAQLKGTTMLGMESMSNRMMRLGSGELYFHEFVSLDQVLRRIDAVTHDDIAAVAYKLLNHENFSTVVISPSAPKTESLGNVA